MPPKLLGRPPLPPRSTWSDPDVASGNCCCAATFLSITSLVSDTASDLRLPRCPYRRSAPAAITGHLSQDEVW